MITLYGIPFPSDEKEENQKKEEEELRDFIKKGGFNLDEKNHDENNITLIHLDPSLHLFKKKNFYSNLQEKFIYKGVVDTKVYISLIFSILLIHRAIFSKKIFVNLYTRLNVF